jgi:succinate dehydrogenase/fumarate reductase-like Fe-S protein
VSPVELKEALKLSPITESIKESWTRNYLTITARPMDNTLALHTFITDFQALKEELENMNSWVGPYTNAKPQTPNQHFQYPEWVLRSYKRKKETQS